MILYIELNRFNQVFRCSTQETEGFLEVETDIKIETILNYAYINKKLIYRPITKNYPLDGFIHEWNGNEWINTSSLEDQREHWLNKALETSKKLEEYKNIGLAGGQEYIALEKELEIHKKNYINACQSEAIAIDKHMSSRKPAK